VKIPYCYGRGNGGGMITLLGHCRGVSVAYIQAALALGLHAHILS
jgi:hypothetical protein